MEEKTKIFTVLVICAALVIGILVGQSGIINWNPDSNSGKSEEDSGDLKKFNSYDEIKNFVKAKSLANNYYGGGIFGAFSGEARIATDTAMIKSGVAESASAPMVADGGGASDYSQTNIQVEGVDEADFVKNDGKYIYLVSGGKLIIVDAYPATDMKKLSETDLGFNNNYGYYGEVNEIFVNDDRLVVFGRGYENVVSLGMESVRCLIAEGCPSGRTVEKTLIYIYDLKNKSSPNLIHNISVDGHYVNSRMIGDYVYTVSQKEVNIYFDEEEVLPMVRADGVEKVISPSEIYYFDSSDEDFVFSIISSLDIGTGKMQEEVYLTGRNGALYVSEKEIYLTSYNRKTQKISQEDLLDNFALEVLSPLLPAVEANKIKEILDSSKSVGKRWAEIQTIIRDYSNSLSKEKKSEFDKSMAEAFSKFERDFNKDLEKTVIHKINVQNGDIEYNDKGEVPGRVLNQFSMDEHNENFRIATTTGDTWDGRSLNHIYVLDKNMQLAGSVENLAEGERIYSARFLGDKAYMVTFKQVDPLFVIDLKDPKKPEVLGYLKIPGYSDYLHPYDENHIIGIGKDTTDKGLYQGLKIALFDITNVSAPKEEAKALIGDRGSDSFALQDHKAFLFDKKRNLLALPVSVAKINESRSEGQGRMIEWAYGDVIYRGAYVFNVSEKGITLLSKITHFNATNGAGYDYDYTKEIKRSLLMDQTLYTVSFGTVKANNLNDFSEVKSLELFEAPVKYNGEIIY